MSGTLILKSGGSWCKRLLVWGGSGVVALLAAGIVARCMERWGVTGLISQLAVAMVVPALLWIMAKQLSQVVPGVQGEKLLPWSIGQGVLHLGDAEIPLESIKTVHCWNKNGSWTVNIETTGKNQLLRAVDEGTEQERSVQRLRELVDALGYGAQWREM